MAIEADQGLTINNVPKLRSLVLVGPKGILRRRHPKDKMLNRDLMSSQRIWLTAVLFRHLAPFDHHLDISF